MNAEAPKKKTPWSKQLFIAAAFSGGWITLQIATGENLSKHQPRPIDRLDHLAWLVLPVIFCTVGFGFLVHERRAKKTPSSEQRSAAPERAAGRRLNKPVRQAQGSKPVSGED